MSLLNDELQTLVIGALPDDSSDEEKADTLDRLIETLKSEANRLRGRDLGTVAIKVTSPAAAHLSEKCAHCHLFIEANYSHEDGRDDYAPYIHHERGDEADEAITSTHDAEPSGLIATLETWRQFGPPEMRARFVPEGFDPVHDEPEPDPVGQAILAAQNRTWSELPTGASLVVLIYNMPGDEGAVYTLRTPDGSERRIGEASDAYSELAGIIDDAFEQDDDAAMQAVYVVDGNGRTAVFYDQAEAEADFVHEGYAHATHLSITKAQAPADLSGDDLVNWCIANIPPITCEAQ